MEITAVYYTANKENEKFEEQIIKELKKRCSAPIISVSQKPIDVGKNICVGDVGRSGINTFRQVQIGVEEAKTKNICLAESDTLYPEEYFKLVPSSSNSIFYVRPLYVLWKKKNQFFVKSCIEAAVVADREHLLKSLDEMLKDKPQWYDNKVKVGDPIPKDSRGEKGGTKVYKHVSSMGYCKIPNPIVTFRTKEGMHYRTPYSKNNRTEVLPYWGSAKELNRRFHG